MFSHIDETNILFSDDKTYMTYDNYFKHSMQAIDIN